MTCGRVPHRTYPAYGTSSLSISAPPSALYGVGNRIGAGLIAARNLPVLTGASSLTAATSSADSLAVFCRRNSRDHDCISYGFRMNFAVTRDPPGPVALRSGTADVLCDGVCRPF